MELQFKNKAYIGYKNIQLLQKILQLKLAQDPSILKKIDFDLSFISNIVTTLQSFIADNTLFVERTTYALLLHHVVNSFIKLLQTLLKDTALHTSLEAKICSILAQQKKYQKHLMNIRGETIQDENSQFGASEPELQMLIQDFSID